MVGVSTKGVYAIAAMHALYHAPKSRLMQIKEIAAVTQISHGYLEQILSTLKKDGFVTSVRGANGGYKLSCEAKDIVVLDILESVEGQFFLPHENSGASVILESFWVDAQSKVREVFNIKLSDLDQSFQTYFYEI
ncbi:Rrf2 family transcriptional regulator [Sulfurimonas aquatica]|uniref:Rrf2 family transcriptional regulator n=1 Tax=Sulfurimonas aquatica TaxID=2672570 RepID=A0A975B1F1_9BACT|nr:Rrf2 family transcriptional regulator [Sulfurimonas aquatica]QSZ42447.1 Rrf2 family transcriptional regulator [Sulfurimonas aquatica]